jgi:hypothetical protein
MKHPPDGGTNFVAPAAGGVTAAGGAILTGGGGGGPGSHGGAIGSGGGAMGIGGVVATGGPARTGAAGGSGGPSRAGGSTGAGGGQAGGARASGGSVAGGGAPTGGLANLGGRLAPVGGTLGRGGAVSAGGSIGAGGTKGTGGVRASGGSDAGGTPGRGGAAGTGGTCGNGILDPGEECDDGAANANAAAFWITQGGQSFAASPLVRAASCGEFYDYRSSSSHTGFEATGTSRIMLYLDRASLRLSLVFFHGIDQDSSGIEQPFARVQFLFSGLPETTTIDVADEDSEMLQSSATTATGYWRFTNNTDGGALSTLPFPGDWEILLEPSFVEGISTWTWLQSDGALIGLDLGQPLTIKASSKHGTCRPDCTAPRCGDGVLDAGEICDYGDGAGEGCSFTCVSFN